MTISELIEKIENLQQYEPSLETSGNGFWEEVISYAEMDKCTNGGWINVDDLKNILEEFLTGLTLEAIEAVINAPNKNKPKIEAKLLPGKDLG